MTLGEPPSCALGLSGVVPPYPELKMISLHILRLTYPQPLHFARVQLLSDQYDQQIYEPVTAMVGVSTHLPQTLLRTGSDGI